MTLAQQMNDDVDDVFLNTDEHAEEIRYLPENGEPRTLNAVVFREEDMLTQAVDLGRDIDRTVTIHLGTSVLTGVASIDERDQFEIDGQAYSIQGRPVRDGYGMQKLLLKSVKRREASHPQYRR